MSLLIDIASYVPTSRVDNLANCEKFGTTPDFLDGKIGTRNVARMGEGENTATMAVNAGKSLLQKTGVPLEEISCLVVCTQNPVNHGIPHTSALVQRDLGMGDGTACFDISLGCSGYVYGLSVVAGFLEANQLDYGILITADPYSPILDADDKNTALLFGDAATATLISRKDEGAGWKLGLSAFATRGQSGHAINNDSGLFQMNGRAVFEFCVKEVPVQIRSLVAKAGLTLAEIDFFVLHQGSKFIVEQIGRALGVETAKVPLYLENIGNTVSSSIPLVLENRVLKAEAKRLLLSGFGVGLSWASCLLERKENLS